MRLSRISRIAAVCLFAAAKLATGLDKEPFIAGIDTMIDKMTANIANAQSGFRAVFSAQPFPGYTEKLEWRRPESGGNWHYSEHYKMEGWLCPALFNISRQRRARYTCAPSRKPDGLRLRRRVRVVSVPTL